MKRYSVFAVAREALRYHQGWGRAWKSPEPKKKYDAIIIGCSQAIALVPGTSRSGITITSALTLGYSREHAAHFSFLMSVPIITMSLLYKGSQLMTSDSSDLAPLGIGIVFSAVTAYFCISGFMHFVTKIGMLPFVIYRILLGSALFWIAYSQ